MKQLAIFILWILAVCLEIVQMVVVVTTLGSWLDVGLFWSIVFTVILSYLFPIAPTIIGIYGAITILDWNIFLAIAVFAPLLLINLLLLSISGISVGIAGAFETIKNLFKRVDTKEN